MTTFDIIYKILEVLEENIGIKYKSIYDLITPIDLGISKAKFDCIWNIMVEGCLVTWFNDNETVPFITLGGLEYLSEHKYW